MSHTYTSERIYHFTCSECSNWWSYASEDKLRMKEMTCPHCGEAKSIESKDKPVVRKDLEDIKELTEMCLDNLSERHYYRSPHEAETIDNLKNIIVRIHDENKINR